MVGSGTGLRTCKRWWYEISGRVTLQIFLNADSESPVHLSLVSKFSIPIIPPTSWAVISADISITIAAECNAKEDRLSPSRIDKAIQ